MNFDPISFAMGMNAAKGSGGSSGGGGSVEGVHFVTFMSEDGNTELYKRPVADGDDCADPVIRGLISEPEKESTAQYNYTHVGWSASPNGALDGNILKAVTADKTVYANFAAVLRYYTVTYYDSDRTTVLKTESLAYGATPSYAPIKENYVFNGWEPELATVTGNVSYVAQFEEKIVFETATWAKIAEVADAGIASDMFAVGDTKTFETKQGVSVTAKIIGFNHDDIYDGTGKAGITIEFLSPFDLCYPIDSLDSAPVWSSSTSSYYFSPPNTWNVTTKSATSTKEYLMIDVLPDDLVAVMKKVAKKIYNGSQVTTSDYYVWTVSCSELGFTVDTSTPVWDEGECYEAYSENKVMGTKYSDILKHKTNGTACKYWTRSKAQGGNSVRSVSADGILQNTSSTAAYFASFPHICI